MIDYSYIAEDWIEHEKARLKSNKQFKKTFVGQRGYPHFDSTVSLHDHENITWLLEKLNNEDSIKQWGFFPFIKREQRNRRYRHKVANDEDENHSPLQSRNQKKFTHVKSRPILYAAHTDSCLFAYFNNILKLYYEPEVNSRNLDENIIAYRSLDQQNNIDFAKSAFDYLAGLDEDFDVLLIDIKSFFDTIPHVQLVTAVKRLLGSDYDSAIDHIMVNLTNYRYVEEDELFKLLKTRGLDYFVRITPKLKRICKLEDYNRYVKPVLVKKNNTNRGIPQGSPVSGQLANVSLLEVDTALKNHLNEYPTSFFQRYSDDILIVSPKNKSEDVFSHYCDLVGRMGLEVSVPKTELFEMRKGKLINATYRITGKKSQKSDVQYLGLEWNGERIVLRPSTVARRLRPRGGKLLSKYWRYHKQAIDKTQDLGVLRQFNRIRKTIKNKGQDNKNS